MGFGCCRGFWLEDFWEDPHKSVFGFFGGGGEVSFFGLFINCIGRVCVCVCVCIYVFPHVFYKKGGVFFTWGRGGEEG